MNRITFDKKLPDGFSNKSAIGLLPEVLPSPLKLNLGCGLDVREDFINIDLFSEDARVVRMDVRKLELPDNSVDLILASDILEHFSHRETSAVLAEWARVLKPNATIVLRCPSLQLQAKAYINKIWNADIASYMIFGGQTNSGDYHCVAFDEFSIKQHLQRAGLQVVSFTEEDTPQTNGFINLNMTVRATKVSNITSTSTTTTTTNNNNNNPNNTTTDNNNTNTNNNSASTNNSINNIDSGSHKEQNYIISNEIVNNKKELENKIINQNLNTTRKPAINIVWEGSQFVYHSLALINREHCINLIKAGVAEITIVPYEPDAFTAKESPRFENLYSHDIRYKPEVAPEVASLPYAWIRHQWPPKSNPPNGAKWIINQPWEFSKLPIKIAEIFSQADEIWTPSNFCRKSFVDSGIDFNKVQIIPNGVNPDIFTPEGKIYNLATKKQLKFLFVGGTTYRKGFDILLMAFIRAFKKIDNVCLVVKSAGAETYYKNQSMADIISKVQAQPDCPEIIHISGDNYKEEDIASLYRACDVFVSPYRGEGFSLPTLEAMACGLPVIITKGGPTDDFTTDNIAWYINSTQKSIGTTLDGESLVEEAFILEPDLQELVDTLQYLYNSPENNFSMGMRASSLARTNWSWQRATLKILSRLDYLYNTNMSPEAANILIDIEDDYIKLGEAETAFLENNFNKSEELYVQVLENTELENKIITHCFNRLAQISITNNQLISAYKYIEASKALETNNPETIWLESIILSAEEKYVEALELITPVVSNWNNIKFRVTLGIALEKYLLQIADILMFMEDYAQALQVYTTVLQRDNYSAEACYGLGICYKKAGLLEESKNMLEWAIKYNPQYEFAKKELENLMALE